MKCAYWIGWMAAAGFLGGVAGASPISTTIALDSTTQTGMSGYISYTYRNDGSKYGGGLGNSGTVNLGSVKTTDGTGTRTANSRMLVQFVLPSNLSGATVQSATLSVFEFASLDSDGDETIAIDAHRLTTGWDASSTLPSWTKPDSAHSWTTAGGDYISTATDSQNGFQKTAQGNKYVHAFIDFNVAADVQAFADGTVNHGWILIGPEANSNTSPSSYDSIYMDDYYSTSPGYTPRLQITYTPVPEPTSLGLLALGAGGLLLRRRRGC